MNNTSEQLIFREPVTTNFSSFSNEFFASEVPPAAFKILSYLLSRPTDWKVRRTDLQKKLGLSAYAVQAGLKWLLDAGYAVYRRLKTGHTIWKFFTRPFQTPPEPSLPDERAPESSPESSAASMDAERKNTCEPPKTQPLDCPEAEHPVWPKLNDAQQKAASHLLKKLNDPTQTALVLSELLTALNNRKLSSVPGYLKALVKAANTGTLTQTDAKPKRTVPLYRPEKPKKTEARPKHVQQFLNGARAALGKR
jgi:hypothetical protein